MSIIAIIAPQTEIWRIGLISFLVIILILPFFNGSGGDEQLVINLTWPNQKEKENIYKKEKYNYVSFRFNSYKLTIYIL